MAEIALALIGLAYVFGAEDATYKIHLLGLFALVALAYLSVGFWVVRHGRDQPRAEERPTTQWRRKLRRKFSFLFTVVASLTGLAAASDVLVHPGADERDATVKTLGVLVVFCAWTLLHVGYAAFYRWMDDDESSSVQPGRGPAIPRGDAGNDGRLPVLRDHARRLIRVVRR